jgi:dihydropteroate synthase
MTSRARLGEVTVGDGLPVAVAAALNVSPESFYPGSVVTQEEHLLRAGEAMAAAGAAFVDVGAMSTAPYLDARVSESEEADRLGWAVERLVTKLGITVSADTCRSVPARAALEAGARIINDVSGLTGDPRMAALVARARVGLIVMASDRSAAAGETSGGAGESAGREDPVAVVRAQLAASLDLARAAGVDPSMIVVDPGIGFFRDRARAWHEWDCAVLAGLGGLRDLGRPVCVGASRKSFIGAVAGEADPAGRLPGSIAAAAIAVLGGAGLIRAHDVAETVQAVKVAEAIRRARERD